MKNKSNIQSTHRRSVLKGIAGGAFTVGAGALGVPQAFAQSKQVVVRGLGGAYQEAMEKAIYKPFTEETGIKVVVLPASAAQIRASVAAEAGNTTTLMPVSSVNG